VCVETGSHPVAQAGLELSIFLPHLLGAGITGMHHQDQLLVKVLEKNLPGDPAYLLPANERFPSPPL
jgi:hypothetical protein